MVNEMQRQAQGVSASASAASALMPASVVEDALKRVGISDREQVMKEGQRYYPVAQLDQAPGMLEDVNLVYPVEAGMLDGKVLLRLHINSKGEVDDVAVVHSNPEGVFDEAAVAAFRHARYAPGVLAGAPVGAEVLVEVNFSVDAQGEALRNLSSGMSGS